jgi:CubicO group peptidase (beta-lactamase class C family)
LLRRRSTSFLRSWSAKKGLDHAGEPAGVGLGWIHLLPITNESHIIEKTGGGAGFSTYIAVNHSRHTAIFLAATDGPYDTHLNLFNGANKLLLAVESDTAATANARTGNQTETQIATSLDKARWYLSSGNNASAPRKQPKMTMRVS